MNEYIQIVNDNLIYHKSDGTVIKLLPTIEDIMLADNVDRLSEITYGNEHNCMMTIFGECSYAETGCGDCVIVEKVRKALSANRPQGKWITEYNGNGWNDYWDYTCPHCGKTWRRADNVLYDANYCPNCGAQVKGVDEEE